MKFRLLLLAVLWGLIASAQPSAGSYTPINLQQNIKAVYLRGAHLPAGGNPALQVGQWRGAGAVYIDTVNAKRLYYYIDGIWHAAADESEVAYTDRDIFGSIYKESIW